MRKLALLASILGMGYGYSLSQKLGIEVGGGYSFTTTSQLKISSDKNFSQNSSLTKMKIVPLKFGSGFTGKLNLRYEFNNNLFFQSGVRYLSNDVSYTEEKLQASDPQFNYSEYEQRDYDIYFSFIDIHTLFGINHQIGKKSSLSIGAGPLINSRGRFIETENYSLLINSPNFHEDRSTLTETETKTRLSAGAIGDIGFNYAINSKLALSLHSTFRLISFQPKKSIIQRYEINGNDRIASLTTNDRETEFENSVVLSYPEYNTPNTPAKGLRSYNPNSQIELSLGLSYSIGMKSNVIKDTLKSDRKKIYLDFGGGYGVPLGRSAFVEFREVENINADLGIDNKQTEYISNPYSFGSGIMGKVTGGVYIKKHFAVELSQVFNYSKMESLSTYQLNTNYGSIDEKSESEISGQMVRTLLGIRIEQKVKSFLIYSKAGISIGYLAKLKYEVNNSSTRRYSNGTSESSTSELVYKLYGGATFGPYAGLGLNFGITDRLQIFGEALTIAQNYSPQKGSLIKFKRNGVDVLHEYSKSYREIEFVDEYDPNDSNPSKPRKVLRISEPFSAVYIQAGIRFSY